MFKMNLERTNNLRFWTEKDQSAIIRFKDTPDILSLDRKSVSFSMRNNLKNPIRNYEKVRKVRKRSHNKIEWS